MVRVSYQNIEEQYEQIKAAACGRQACSVMILVAHEVDAMASAKMLTNQLKRDHITYNLRPVHNFAEVEYVYKTFMTSDIKTIFMINCGAVSNVPKAFDLESGGDVRCFIMDNHRPFHLRNIHSNYNVVVFDDQSEIEYDAQYLPSNGDDISSGAEDDGEESGEDEDDDDGESKGEFSENGDGGSANGDAYAAAMINDAFGDNDDGDGEEIENDEEEDEEEAEEGNDEDGGNDGDAQSSGGAEVNDEGDSAQDAGDNGSVVGEAEGDAEDGDEDNEADQEEGEADEEDEDGVRKSKQAFAADSEGEGVRADGEAEEEDEEVRVVGRKRRINEADRAAKLRRKAIQEYYTSNAGFTAPTAMMMMHLVSGRCGSHVPVEALWQAVLGVTDQYQRGNVPEQSYLHYAGELRHQLGEHMMTASDRVRYSVSNGADGAAGGDPAEMVSVSGSEHGHVQEGPEYRFFLYRHWSLLEAMQHSPYVAAKLSVWNSAGTNRLHELLARMGVPLAQCKQNYQFMAPALRQQFHDQMENRALMEDFRLANPGATFQSFFRYTSFKNPVAASDIVLAATALLETYGVEDHSAALASARGDDEDEMAGAAEGAEGEALSQPLSGAAVRGATKVTSSEAFMEALGCLGMRDGLLRKGIRSALDLQRIIVKKAAVMMDGRDSIMRFNRIYYAYIRKPAAASSSSSSGGAAEADLSEVEHTFGRAMVVQRLGQFIMDVKRNMSRKDGGWTGSALLPLVLLSERADESFLVVGVSPLSASMAGCGSSDQAAEASEEHHNRMTVLTNFRQFFQLAASDINVHIRNNSFDSNSVVVGKADVQDFLGTLDYFLRKGTPGAGNPNRGGGGGGATRG